ncbi:MAG: 3-oxoacyl-[acyl-carrier protein] reductase [Methylobacteriaceae bacterium]|jgi:3-oxoacyl-[acyl-carrier protein] reductase|nr:3-oxoacyl-[acyl-carrier protein] reductase [Methylobacteriaceae bacterium]
MANVIVTGGSRGIGLAIVQILAANEYTVIAIARQETRELAAAREQAPDSLYFVPFDLSEVGKLHELAREVRQRFGPIYGLVNNAGLGTEGILATMPESSIEKLVELNTLAPIVLTKYVVRSMMNEGTGRIVNISSIIASTGYSGLSVYGATKAATIGFTKSLAREVGPLGITVNAVAPGFLETELTASMNEKQRQQIARRSALQRLANVHDVAEAVAFLLSDKARNITGTVVTVDAGSTA